MNGCHSYAHRLVYECTRSEFRQDTHRAKSVIEDIVGGTVAGYRAPSFFHHCKEFVGSRDLARKASSTTPACFPSFATAMESPMLLDTPMRSIWNMAP